MTRKQQRITTIALILTGAVIAAILTLTALRETVSFFYSPADIIGTEARALPPDRSFRLGGLVLTGSIEKTGGTLHFVVTDNREQLPVIYKGIVPALFKENQGIIATGKMGEDGVFHATELLARHDENYMPPEVAKALKKTHNKE